MNQDIVRALVFDVVLEAALKSISVAVPFLSLPIIRPLFEYIVRKIAKILYDELEKQVTFIIIDVQTGQQRKAYEEAVAELKVVEQSLEQTPEEIERAKEKFKSTLRDLIRLKS